MFYHFNLYSYVHNDCITLYVVDATPWST